MSLTAAASGFVVFLLSVSVVQGQRGLRVTYTSTHISAFKGSTVDINCTYSYPPKRGNTVTTFLERLWFTKSQPEPSTEPMDLLTDPDYTGRVNYHFDENSCTLTIIDLRESDSAEYKFKFATNHKGGTRIGEPGVTLSVTGPPSVSVTPGEIVEGSSVTLTCSSDANPAATYTWYKMNGHMPLLQGQGRSYHFTFISSEDTGRYFCKSENQHGQINSSPVFVDVQYAPKLLSVSVTPGEIVEGSSVTLTCSSDANPAATYTWYKENEDSPKASGQIFTFTDIRPEHSGNYYCEAQNSRGHHNSTLTLTVVKLTAESGLWKPAVIGTTSVVVLVVILLFVFLLMSKKRASKQPSAPGQGPDNRGQVKSQNEDDLHYASVQFSLNQVDVIYANKRGARAGRPKEDEGVQYAAVKFIRGSTAPRARIQETGQDAAALYSVINKTH